MQCHYLVATIDHKVQGLGFMGSQDVVPHRGVAANLTLLILAHASRKPVSSWWLPPSHDAVLNTLLYTLAVRTSRNS